MCFYVMKQYTDEYYVLRVIAARVAPYKTKKKAEEKMKKIGKGAFLINQHHEVVAVHGIVH